MGLLVNGQWQDKWYDTKSTGGRFVRENSQFRNWIRRDGKSAFTPEANRYHLYVSLACPWAHRTLIMRRIKKLEKIISISVVHPHMEEHGWTFADWPGCVGDTLYHSDYLYEIYTRAKPDYSGRVTVPVLWDKKTETIVNNESSEILRILNSEFNNFTDNDMDFYPRHLRSEIDMINDRVYNDINNGVYKCGFATEQEPYEESFLVLFTALDAMEKKLTTQRYLAGDTLTEADWRLFTTLVRFDPVYYSHFKCNKKRILDYANLFNYMLELYQYPAVAKTVNLEHIKQHYYHSHRTINPTGIVPTGPDIDLEQTHNRQLLFP